MTTPFTEDLQKGPPTSSGRTDQKPAEQLLETAFQHFYRNGFHASGIDTILASAGVSKMTLYNHFGSKEGLIVAALELRHQRFYNWFKSYIEAKTSNPAQRLLATFDALDAWFKSEHFCGCMFIKVSAEYADKVEEIMSAASGHKKMILDYITTLTKAAGAKNAVTLGKQIFLLTEGAIVDAHVSGNKDAARQAKAAARQLIKASGL